MFLVSLSGFGYDLIKRIKLFSVYFHLSFFIQNFLDVNQSGEIDQKDFELAIEKVCNLRGWPEGHPKNAETYDTMLKIWEGLRAKADKDNDGQVSKVFYYFSFLVCVQRTISKDQIRFLD